MTKEEFIQEAALRMLSSHLTYTMKEVVDNAKWLADELFPDKVEQDTNCPTDLDAEPIGNLIREMDRIDTERVLAKTKKAKENEWNWHPQKAGFAAKVHNACVRLDFEFVSNLISFGRESFRRERSIGEKCCVAIDKALKDLYGITAW